MTITLHNQTTAPNVAAATNVSPQNPSAPSKMKREKARTDIYQTVTDNIIASLEAGMKLRPCPR